MNILIVGFGSIGQRHLQNLLKNYPRNSYYVLKKSNNKDVIKDCKVIANDIYTYYKNINFITHIEDIDKINVAFICNNTSQHIKYALELTKNGIDLFIEKPLSNDSKQLDLLNKLILEHKTICMIGFQAKFHPVFLKLQELIQTQRVTFVHSKWLTYLPKWHPYEDYKKRYAATKLEGGGVTLTMIHEIDILHSLFPDLKLIHSVSGNYSSIGIEAEDYLMVNFESKNTAISLNLSFAQIKEERAITINTNEQTIIGDFIKNTIEIYNLNNQHETIKFQIQRNELFEKEVEHFFSIIHSRQPELNTVSESIDIQKITDKILELS